ncbi:hypothetical protein E4U38_003713 [Claviceps purpurea]|nr:hypothetical protein E4U38_003713 [Claviceps purpurea]KAG6311485.1 hypothetical protein E4U44_004272 [Claviceps purpurea]
MFVFPFSFIIATRSESSFVESLTKWNHRQSTAPQNSYILYVPSIFVHKLSRSVSTRAIVRCQGTFF